MFCVLILLSILFGTCNCKEKEEKAKEADKIKKKDIRDYSDADMERLFEQWEVIIYFSIFIFYIYD